MQAKIHERLLEAARKLAEEEENPADLTFTPQIVSRLEGEKPRSTKNFIRDQEKFLENAKAKAARRIQDADETAVSRPQTLKVSEKMVQDRLK